MFEYVSSKYMRDLYKKEKVEFTDFQKAALIWNAPRKRQEILNALKELSETTTNETLRKQILERVDFEEKIFAAFIENQNLKYVYVLEDEEGDSCGFFANYNLAVKYALKNIKKYETQYSIQKQFIVSTIEDEADEYDGTAVAEVSLDTDGDIVQFWSSEWKEESMIDENRTDRFEDQFINVPFDLAIGTVVKNVVRGTYGVLAQGKKEWEKYIQDIEDGKLQVNFSDIQVIVYELTETGYWSHEHMNPMDLEIEFPPYIQDDEKATVLRKALEAFSKYLIQKENGIVYQPEQVLKYARDYAAICDKKSFWENVIEMAKLPEDIMW